jgi:transketolase
MADIDFAPIARRIRRDIIRMAFLSQGPHVGSALSCVDILATLYHGILRLDPWENRDIFLLSKAHASMVLYATLVSRGILPEEALDTYYAEGGLPPHLDLQTGRGVECSAGSLGHAFNMGLGMAAGFKAHGAQRRVFVLLGDGEMQEGSIWEGALFAPRLGLDNVTAIVDYNNLQGYGRPRDICSFEPVADKWAAFGWDVAEVDGHDHGSLLAALSAEPAGRPRVVIARTIKGKGVSFMEDQLIWHYYVVTQELMTNALLELERDTK